eukprot:scaffold154377_cov53-Attheya_sp.AAC.3
MLQYRPAYSNNHSSGSKLKHYSTVGAVSRNITKEDEGCPPVEYYPSSRNSRSVSHEEQQQQER